MENKILLKQQQDSKDVNEITRAYIKKWNDSIEITDEQADKLMGKAFIGAIRWDAPSNTLQICYGVINGVLKWKAITYQ